MSLGSKKGKLFYPSDFIILKGGESMEENKTLDNGTIVAIRFTNGDTVKIRCSEFSYDEATKCFYLSDDCYSNVAIVPREQVACIYEEKCRVYK